MPLSYLLSLATGSSRPRAVSILSRYLVNCFFLHESFTGFQDTFSEIGDLKKQSCNAINMFVPIPTCKYQGEPVSTLSSNTLSHRLHQMRHVMKSSGRKSRLGWAEQLMGLYWVMGNGGESLPCEKVTTVDPKSSSQITSENKGKR